MKIRYIKLGERGCWEKSCIEEDNTIRFGYVGKHEECLQGKWDVVKEYWLSNRSDLGAATRDVNQTKDFYELSENDIWVTFYQRKMYWCRAHKQVIELEDGTRIRKVIGRWSCNDIKGNGLTIENIDGRVTQVQGFRGTVCSINLPDYVLRKINGEIQPEVEEAQKNLLSLKISLAELINGLWWKDFELLLDLIFAKSGWQRVSVLGKTEKDIDLDLYSPITNRKAFVQIKSSTNIAEIKSCVEAYKAHGQYNEMYMAFHTCTGDIQQVEIDSSVNLLDVSKISELVIHTGLINWLITKRT